MRPGQGRLPERQGSLQEERALLSPAHFPASLQTVRSGTRSSAAESMAASVAGFATAATAKTKLNMGATFPSKLTQLGSMGKILEANVAAISAGELELKFFEPGALVPALELFDAAVCFQRPG